MRVNKFARKVFF